MTDFLSASGWLWVAVISAAIGTTSLVVQLSTLQRQVRQLSASPPDSTQSEALVRAPITQGSNRPSLLLNSAIAVALLSSAFSFWQSNRSEAQRFSHDARTAAVGQRIPAYTDYLKTVQKLTADISAIPGTPMTDDKVPAESQTKLLEDLHAIDDAWASVQLVGSEATIAQGKILTAGAQALALLLTVQPGTPEDISKVRNTYFEASSLFSEVARAELRELGGLPYEPPVTFAPRS